jgi:type VI secretion system secreted protein VgrG
MHFHGVISNFEQLEEMNNMSCYEAVLVPRLWQSNLYLENQLFLDKSVPEIIEEILQQTGLTGQDYELRLTGDYRPWEYICQYQETDFNFISRWMEREGISYFFEQTDDCEKLIITDSKTAHNRTPHLSTISYNASADMNVQEEIVSSFVCSQKRLPSKVQLRDYNYRKPSLEVKGEADVDEEGQGTVYVYGEHFKTPDEGNALAAIRAEALLCREKIFHGESTSPSLVPGYLFTLEDHFRDTFNQEYLITSVHHHGSQSAFLPSGTQPAGIQQGAGGEYGNSFTCISGELHFRPKQVASKPRFYGSVNAKVDASGDGRFAELDDQGRYKVILPFDQSGRGGGKASRWVRMAQPHSGPGYGMHLPLHKGAEVLLTFIDGDPDRPIISATVPNPENQSPVDINNLTQHIINTRYGHNFVMDDDDSAQSIRLCTPGGYCLELSDSAMHVKAYTPAGRTLNLNDGQNCIDLKTPDQFVKISDNDGSIRIQSQDEHKIELMSAGINVQSNKGHQVYLDDEFNSVVVSHQDGIHVMNINPDAFEAWSTKGYIGLKDSKLDLDHSTEVNLTVGSSSIKMTPASVEIKGGFVFINC